MSKSVRGANNKDPYLEGFELHSKETGISIAEILGLRDNQQDAVFSGRLADGCRAVTNPTEFFKDTINNVVEGHTTCNNGTTLCSAIITPPASERGLPQITTANLGDSRASLIIKYKKQSRTEYVSISLTEDHTPNLERIQKYISDNGGVVIKNRVLKHSSLPKGLSEMIALRYLPSMGVAATIGDAQILKATEDGIPEEDLIPEKDFIVRTPDIWTHNLFQIYQDLKIDPSLVEDVDLLITCDGVWERDKIYNDFSYKLGGNNTLSLHPTAKTANSESLSSLKEKFDQFSQKKNPKHKSFSDFVVTQAYEKGSGDNISAIEIPLIKDFPGSLRP